MFKNPEKQQPQVAPKENPDQENKGQTLSPPTFQLKADPSTANGGQVANENAVQMQEAEPQTANTYTVTSGELTATGEGSDAATSHIHWPGTDASGVTLGKGYDIGNRTASQVIEELTAAGMSQEQAEKISEGVGLTGTDAQTFVTNNKDDIGTISTDVQYALLADMLVEYTDKAKSVATNTEATTDGNGYYTNARGREIKDGVEEGTYRMTEEQWNNLHPAMIEFLTDLKYQGGYYLYDRVAQINEVLIENDGNQLEQFKAVRELFIAQEDEDRSYMDRYGVSQQEGTGNTELFYDQTAEDLEGATTRRNRVRLAYLTAVISALEGGQTVVVSNGEGSDSGSSSTTSTTTSETETTAEVETTPDLGNSEATTAAVESTQTGGFDYVVQSGESLGILARKHGVTVEALKTANADKLHRWGDVEGFMAGETIFVPGTTPSQSTPTNESTETETETETSSLDYDKLADDVFAAMFLVFGGTGWGTDEEAVYAALAQLENNQEKIDTFISTYQTKFGRDVEADIRSDFYDIWNGDHSQKALGYLNITSGTPSTGDREQTQGDQEQTQGTTTDYRSDAITGSVGAGGDNDAHDVKIIQQNLIHLGHLAPGGEVTTVAGIQDGEKVQDSQIPATIQAIQHFQQTLGGGVDGRVDNTTGGSWDAMKARLELMTEYSSHEIQTEPIDPVMETSDWISQFRDGSNTMSDGSTKNMTITGDGRGLLENEKEYTGKKNGVCCFDAAKAMVNNNGGSVNTVKSSNIQTMFQHDGQSDVLGAQAELGAKYIDKALLAGKPVFISVDDGRTATYNYDNTTEHYIVIMAKVIKDGKIYYRFFDPGTAHGATKGYAETNLLYMGEDYSLTGDKPGSTRDYTVAHIR